MCYNAAYIRKIITEMTEEILLQEIRNLKTPSQDTYGAKACRQYHIWGVRGLAAEGYRIVTEKAGQLARIPLEEGEMLLEGTAELNDWCIARQISPGGCADLLAATLFLYKLLQIPVR